MATGVPARLTLAEGRRFALTVGSAFLVLAGVAWRRERPYVAGLMAAGAGVLLLAGSVVPTRLGPVYRTWMAMGRGVSKVTSPIVLWVVYFFVFTPFALVTRLTGRRTLVRSATGGSWWIGRSPAERQRKDMERQF